MYAYRQLTMFLYYCFHGIHYTKCLSLIECNSSVISVGTTLTRVTAILHLGPLRFVVFRLCRTHTVS